MTAVTTQFNVMFAINIIIHCVCFFPFIPCSPYSDVFEFSAGAGPPSVPQPPSLTESLIHSLSLQWTPPQNNGAEITSYKLEMEDPSSVC